LSSTSSIFLSITLLDVDRRDAEFAEIIYFLFSVSSAPAR
jgi:hypothetical protein